MGGVNVSLLLRGIDKMYNITTCILISLSHKLELLQNRKGVRSCPYLVFLMKIFNGGKNSNIPSFSLQTLIDGIRKC
jgi:hypothetical protein